MKDISVPPIFPLGGARVSTLFVDDRRLVHRSPLARSSEETARDPWLDSMGGLMTVTLFEGVVENTV